jgi:8-oxo-dGTP diphosphatase
MEPVESEIAVVAILCHQGRCLFLKRNNPPLNWCPPAGRLRQGEDYIVGIKREILEETGIEADVLLPVDTWKGCHLDEDIFSVTFVCKAATDQVILSEEHSSYRWIEFKHLESIPLDTDFDTKSWPYFIQLAERHFNDQSGFILSHGDLVLAQKEIVSRLAEAKVQLAEIQQMKGSILEKWQHMIGIVLPVQYEVIQKLGLPEGQKGLTKFNEQLMTLSRSDPELAALNEKKWMCIFQYAFSLTELRSISLEEARNLINEISAAMVSNEFLTTIDQAVRELKNAAPVTVRQKLLELLIPLHMAVIVKYGFEGDNGYVLMQKALMDHFHDPFIIKQSAYAQETVFRRAGLIDEKK